MTKRKSKPPRKDPNIYPPGWDYRRAKQIADYYDARKDEDVLKDAATAKSLGTMVWMEVPKDMLPEVLKLISRHQKVARPRRRAAVSTR